MLTKILSDEPYTNFILLLTLYRLKITFYYLVLFTQLQFFNRHYYLSLLIDIQYLLAMILAVLFSLLYSSLCPPSPIITTLMPDTNVVRNTKFSTLDCFGHSPSKTFYDNIYLLFTPHFISYFIQHCHSPNRYEIHTICQRKNASRLFSPSHGAFSFILSSVSTFFNILLLFSFISFTIFLYSTKNIFYYE